MMGIAGVQRAAVLCAIRGATVENTHLEMYKLGLWGLGREPFRSLY